MRRFQRLRWRLLAAQLAVVIVGVLVLALVANLLSQQLFSSGVAIADPAARFRGAINQALVIAAISASLVGVLTSAILLRAILRPLTGLAHSAQRIASGRYDERVPLPNDDDIAEVAESFNQMAEALEQVEAQRIALIANVAHELRTPLTGLEGYLAGINDGIFSAEPETISAMQSEVRRLRRLVDDLQALSRAEAGQVAIHPQTLDFAELAERVVAQLRPQAEAAEVRLEFSASHALMVDADPDRLRQVVINVIGNAIRYTPEGGQIQVEARALADQALLVVQDSGIGIPASDLPYIFERFYRVDRSRARASGGSGIGLTIARHLLWAMGGEISAASAGVGHGTTMTISLPRARSSP